MQVMLVEFVAVIFIIFSLFVHGINVSSLLVMEQNSS